MLGRLSDSPDLTFSSEFCSPTDDVTTCSLACHGVLSIPVEFDILVIGCLACRREWSVGEGFCGLALNEMTTVSLSDNAPSSGGDTIAACRLFHLRLGWWSLLVFLSLGIVLEILHGLKVGWYLDDGNVARRQVWTLAHTHGTLLAVFSLLFAASLPHFPNWNPSSRRLASRCLLAAILLMPTGFFLGGFWIYSGDPGLGILLVIPGAAFLFIAVLKTALATRGAASANNDETPLETDPSSE